MDIPVFFTSVSVENICFDGVSLTTCLKNGPDTVGELKSAENWYHLKNAGLKAHALTGCHDEGTLA
jgi:hypothetical protein